ncbi:hypothetical protein ACP4OV_001548 [Aristida adscensionis]
MENWKLTGVRAGAPSAASDGERRGRGQRRWTARAGAGAGGGRPRRERGGAEEGCRGRGACEGRGSPRHAL